MAKKIYVGNMSYNTTEEQLWDLFAQYRCECKHHHRS